ncbi:hypothetical protein PV396_09185 [Streptomyces sp. ME02-8801-2C]|uniref:hypothetical protein n=1 Tax=Streptomyces sp. ME02-8801-2C TaxID=3028680 RepID=UPI0029ABAB1C|nr:hypothetical protein [Streptomyces sp. ME02-8801-2C]MDX3452111.1 hypothetical protein [Streptomyces sp. ME02-8801-2C]
MNGPQFHGSIHGSQIAIGNHDVSQSQYLPASPGVGDLAEAVGALLDALGLLGLRADDERGVRQDAEAALDEAAQQEPDAGRLRGLLERIRTVLVPLAAGATAGAAAGVNSGTAQLAQSLLASLQQALP